MPLDVLLVFPYFNEENDKSIFRYPPLGLGYLASVLREKDISVKILDGTFSSREQAISAIHRLKPRILGIYSMVTINHHAISIARECRMDVELIVAGGPLPSLVPEEFLDVFDLVVMHEGEQTFLELVMKHLAEESWQGIKGISYKSETGRYTTNGSRPLEENLDSLPFPARDMFPNKSYKKYWTKYHGYSATSQITTRGCPYLCDFCSNPVFGRSYRERSAKNVVAEMSEISSLGYDRIFFTDDCFTQNPKRVDDICDILTKESIDIEWMCLSRADTLSKSMARNMKDAGCVRIFFGIESGNQRMLKVMNKRIVLGDVVRAVKVANGAGIETGGFFILGYPGETNESLLDTLQFSSRIPLDYLSYSFPYPIIGTGLYTKVRERITNPEWRKQRGEANRHQLLFTGNFSQTKLQFARLKGGIQHSLRRKGVYGKAAAYVFEQLTDPLVTVLR
ncbi:MAG: B12-binding domain-containing radical SAM protein [Candidatus Thorarchaeota archaeon]